LKLTSNPSKPFDAAYQGAAGAFSEEAALRFIGEQAALLPCRQFEDVFDAVNTRRALRGVIPIENTLAGSVHDCYDLLRRFELKIAGETVLHVSHNLIALPETRFEEIREVRSHPVALAQCENLFRRHPQLVPVPVYDTAGAVETLKLESKRHVAAIASVRAAVIHGAYVLLSDIQDQTENYTRFLLIKRDDVETPDESLSGLKTTVLFKTADRPGALFECLRPFAELGIDLKKLESRPLRDEPFQYLFYADLVGNTADAPMGEALARLKKTAAFVRVLGSYALRGAPERSG
jgi:prephenate dehydratase